MRPWPRIALRGASPPFRRRGAPPALRALLAGACDLLWPPSCPGCGAWLPPATARDAEADPLCGACLGPLSAPVRLALPDGPSACFAAAEFRGAAESWIVRFKYPPAGVPGLDPGPGRAVAALVRRAARALPGPPPDRVVPVPLHPQRLRQRGFNPAAVLAVEVARARGGRLEPLGLVRTRDTPSQTGLDRRARRRNVTGAFAARSRCEGRVCLVDDVVTTGATLAACCRALEAAGASEVVAVCAAWTPFRRDRGGPDPSA